MIKVTDKRRSPALTRTQAETDVEFVALVARLADVHALSEKIVAIADVA